MTAVVPGGHPRGPTVYFPAPSADGAGLAARHRLSDQVRALAELCVDVDAELAGPEVLEELAASVAALGDRLGALPRRRPGSISEVAHSLAELGPVVGQGNPVAPPLLLRVEGEVVRGSVVYGSAYEGGPGDVHGGVIAAAFDDLLGCAQMIGPVSGRTGTLTVRFRAASPLGRRIDFEGRLDRVDGRKIFCTGEAHCGDTLLAEGEAIFVAARPTGAIEPTSTED